MFSSLDFAGGFFDNAAFDLSGRPWALLPSVLDVLARELRHRAAWRPTAAGFYARDGAGRPTAAPPSPRAGRGDGYGPQVQYAGRGTVGLLPLMGVLLPRECALTAMIGGTGLESWCAALRQLADAPTVKSIVLVVDSPGGSVFGCTEAAAEVRAAAKQKKVVAAVSSLAASAAYWVISGASEIAITPSGMCGSVGVYTQHEDHSGELAKAGVKVTTIASSKYKAEDDPAQPLTDEARDYLQGMVNAVGDLFVRDVAKGRGISESKAAGPVFGQGRCLLAKAAVAAGMADRVATLQDVVNGLASGASNGGRHMPGAVLARLARIQAEAGEG